MQIGRSLADRRFGRFVTRRLVSVQGFHPRRLRSETTVVHPGRGGVLSVNDLVAASHLSLQCRRRRRLNTRSTVGSPALTAQAFRYQNKCQRQVNLPCAAVQVLSMRGPIQSGMFLTVILLLSFICFQRVYALQSRSHISYSIEDCIWEILNHKVQSTRKICLLSYTISLL